MRGPHHARILGARRRGRNAGAGVHLAKGQKGCPVLRLASAHNVDLRTLPRSISADGRRVSAPGPAREPEHISGMAQVMRLVAGQPLSQQPMEWVRRKRQVVTRRPAVNCPPLAVIWGVVVLMFVLATPAYAAGDVNGVIDSIRNWVA